MRVLIDDGFSMTRPTGIGRYSAYLLHALERHGDGVEATRIAIPRLTAVRPRPLRRAAYLAYLATGHAADARRRGVELVHFTNFQAAYRHPPGLRYAVTIHDLVPFRYPETKSPLYVRYLRRAIARAVRTVDVIFADSHAVRDEILGDLRVDPDRVRVCYMGPEIEEPAPHTVAPGVAALLGAGAAEAPYLLFVGSLERRKNVTALVRALPLLRERWPELQLVLAGRPGIGYAEIDAAIGAARAAGGSVHVLAGCADRDLAVLYAACAAFVFPSFYEGFGVPLLEAMRCGAPIVASDIPTSVELTGGAAEIVAGTPEGIADGVQAVLGSAAHRAALVARGRARVAGFTPERTARELLAGYRAALAR